jgi:hypothetical protein
MGFLNYENFRQFLAIMKKRTGTVNQEEKLRTGTWYRILFPKRYQQLNNNFCHMPCLSPRSYLQTCWLSNT